MFETSDRKPLAESDFESWLEKGRDSQMGYHFLLVIWNELEEAYQPVFVTSRTEIETYQTGINAQEVLVAVYDVYSESRVLVGEGS